MNWGVAKSVTSPGGKGNWLIKGMQSNFWRFMSFFRPHRWRVAQTLFFMFFSSALALPGPLIWRRLINGMTHDPRLPQSDQLHLLMFSALAILALSVTGSLVGLATSYLMTVLGQRLLFDLRHTLYRHLQRLSLRYYQSRQTGRIISRLLYDVDTLQSLATGGVNQLINSSVMLVGAAALIFYLNWKLAIIAIVTLPLYVLVWELMHRKIRWASLDVRDKWSEISGNVHEKIAGAWVVKAFTTERPETRKFVQDAREFLRFNIRQNMLGNLMGTSAGLLSQIGTIAIWYFGGRQMTFGKMEWGDISAFLAYTGYMWGPVLSITNVNQMIQNAMASIDRMFETLDTLPDVREKEEPFNLDNIQGQVEFRNVFFGYEPDELVLKNVSLMATPNAVTALVGPSGGGKTTLINLIPRFYDPMSGSILVDGVDIRDVRLNTLRQQIAIVLQDTYLFSGTIKENIRYGRPNATDEEAVEAAKTANAHDFIMEQKYGYDTEIGERGARLSGGQKQRIGIARAVLRNPKILILDEATSMLDSEAEKEIRTAISRLMEGRTTFVIAHRLSTVMNADQILVIEDGEITEKGTHDELARAGGRYSRLCKIQFQAGAELASLWAATEDDGNGKGGGRK